MSGVPDFRPGWEQVPDLEILFGDLLYAGHSVQEAANFLLYLENGDVT